MSLFVEGVDIEVPVLHSVFCMAMCLFFVYPMLFHCLLIKLFFVVSHGNHLFYNPLAARSVNISLHLA